MSNTLRISGPIKVGSLSAAPANPEEGFIYFNTTSGVFEMYENGSFRQVSAEAIEAHFDGGASKHDATEVDYERADGSKKNIQATSDDVETALTDLDDAIGSLAASPTNYTPADPTIVADHLAGIDSALATAGASEFADNLFRVTGSVDATKKIALEADGLTTATTRTITMPDSNVNLGDIATNNAKVSADGSVTTHSDVTSAGSGAIITASERADIGTNKTHATGDGSDHQDVADLTTLSGSAANSTNHGAFTGSTLSDTETTRSALQALETAVETKAADADVIKKDGSVAYTGNQSMGSNKLTSLADGTLASDAVNKGQLDAAINGLSWKDHCRMATAGSIANLSDVTVADPDGQGQGITLVEGDRILVKDTASADGIEAVDAKRNGIYVVGTVTTGKAPLTRSEDMNSAAEVESASTFIDEGTHANQAYTQTADNVTLDTTALTFIKFSSAGAFSADGNGIEETGGVFSLELDGATLSKSATGLRVAALTASRALESDGSGNLSASATTSTELGHLSGVTSAIQTQLNAKLENISEDTTPSLGGDLSLGANVVIHDADGMKRGSSAANFLEEEYIHSISLLASQTGTAISELTFAHASFEGCEVTYKLKEATSNDVRIGTIRCVTNGTAVALNDVSTETADVGITFSAAVNGANIEIRYDSGSNAVTMRADVKRVKA